MNELEKIDNLYTKISSLIQEARKSVKTAVNIAMVYTYYNIGKMIIDDEQNGNIRAEYGAKVIEGLSNKLTKEFGKGFSIANIRLMRQFYQIYSIDQIRETVFSEFNFPTNPNVERQFFLSWSHYLVLMRIENIEERHFYEIECVKNN
ncbi:MAG: DUF1016 N-terminal domain-containing protein [Anaeroplasma bactoclasticum]|nr:DUF1016 N-terminal domain-containing protein [Anaeroplasma bactoclasticum]MCM1556254.1 DUF1016 N-terminal domain-containing protein [Anaeroplasma bactoclasticum]